MPGDFGSIDDREHTLAETRERLTRLEAEAHRLRAQLARLEAEGEDQQAVQLEAQLAEITHEQSALGAFVVDAEPRGKNNRRKPKPRRPPRPKTKASPAASQVVEAPVIAQQDKDQEQRKKPLAARLRSAPAWATSVGVHVLLFVIFSLLTFVTLQDPPHELFAGPPDGSEDFFDEFSEVDLSPIEIEDLQLEPTDMELAPTELTSLETTEVLEPLESAATGLSDFAPGAAMLPTDAASLMLGESGGQPNAGAGRGDKPESGGRKSGAQFFGRRSKGNRFVFVVDNSGSMVEGRLETTLLELQQSVFAMSPEQEFYIVFYSDQVYPMLYPESVEEMLPATRDNKKRLAQWLTTVEMCSGGRIVPAMEKAASLRPSVLYLLSDGGIGPTYVTDLCEREEWDFVIHTLGMTVRDAEDARKLLAIAQAHGGAFTPVGVNPAAAQMSRQRPIPYHNKGPGPVWGSKVRVRN